MLLNETKYNWLMTNVPHISFSLRLETLFKYFNTVRTYEFSYER